MTIKLSSVFEYCLKIFLFLGVVVFFPAQQGTTAEDAVTFGYMSQELFFRYGTVFLFSLSCMFPRVRELTFRSFPALVVSVLATSLLVGFGIVQRSGLLNLFFGLVFYKIVYEYFEARWLKSFSWWLGWLLLFNLLWCVFQWFGHDPVFTHVDAGIVGKMDSIVGLMRLKVHLGVLSAILAPIMLCYAPCFIPCIIPLLIFSQSSTAAFALVITGIIMGYHRMKNVTLFILSILLLGFGVWFVLFFDMPAGQFGSRFKVWEATLGMSLKGFFLLGSGIGHFKELNMATLQANGQPIAWNWVHNEFLQAFYEFGAVGMACIFAYIIGIHKKSQEFMKDKATLALYASFISILILSCINFPFHLARFAPLMLFMMAGLHSTIDEQEKNRIHHA